MSLASVRRAALLTAGGFALCLSSTVGGLIGRYNEIDPEIEIITYQNGYHGLLTSNFVVVDEEARTQVAVLHRFGGPPIGNSRVKLTNAENLVEHGLVAESGNPLEKVAEQPRRDDVDVLHTIGGDDTNTTATDLAAYLGERDYYLIVASLPKTIDNDIMPIRRPLGAWTAAEKVSEYVQNVISEHRSSPRVLIIHETMGRSCGWLTATDSRGYHGQFKTQEQVPSIELSRERWDIHAVFLPEMTLDIEVEAARLRKVMDEQGNVNILLSEGAGAPEIIVEMEAAGIGAQRDPFGRVKLDTINPSQQFTRQFTSKIEAEKVMVQRSDYFSRSSRANADDLRLIKPIADLAVRCALRSESDVVGYDEENSSRLHAIPFPHVTGGKPFDIAQRQSTEMMAEIGQDMKPTAK